MAETSSERGGALGIAVLGSIVAALFRLSMEEARPGAAAISAYADAFGVAALVCAVVALVAAVVTAAVLQGVRTEADAAALEQPAE